MKSPRYNSANPPHLPAHLRDEMYLKHLRQVEKINNREAEELKTSLQDYHSITELRIKNQQKNKEINRYEQERELSFKNERIHKKIKNIKSMFSFVVVGKQERKGEVHQEEGSIDGQEGNRESRQEKGNRQIESGQNGRSENKNWAGEESQMKNPEEKQTEQHVRRRQSHNRSFHYHYRKKQQIIIENQNQKLISSILNQKSVYHSILQQEKKKREYRLQQSSFSALEDKSRQKVNGSGHTQHPSSNIAASEKSPDSERHSKEKIKAIKAEKMLKREKQFQLPVVTRNSSNLRSMTVGSSGYLDTKNSTKVQKHKSTKFLKDQLLKKLQESYKSRENRNKSKELSTSKRYTTSFENQQSNN